MPPDLALSSTLIGSNYPCLELIFMVPKVFEPLKLTVFFSFFFALSTCPAKNQAGCMERVVHHSHENQKFYLFKIAINEKCQKPKLKVKAITVAMATAV